MTDHFYVVEVPGKKDEAFTVHAGAFEVTSGCLILFNPSDLSAGLKRDLLVAFAPGQWKRVKKMWKKPDVPLSGETL